MIPDFSPYQIMVNVIVREMALDAQRVWVRNQNKKLPTDNELFIALGPERQVPLSSKTYMEQREVVNPPNPIIYQQWEVNRTQLREAIRVDVFSRNNDALFRNWEVLAALRSIYCQQMQEQNSFKIGRLPDSFIDTSAAEGGSNINRFTITFPCIAWYKKDKLLSSGDYYDDFDTRVDVEKTIGTPEGIIEFNISAED